MNVKTMIAAATLAAAPVTAQTTADSRRPVIGKQQVEWKTDPKPADGGPSDPGSERSGTAQSSME